MTPVKIVGWVILIFVLFMLGTDVYAVIVNDSNHPIITGWHAFFFVIGLIAVGMSSDEVADRIAKMALAFRGKA